MRAKGMFIATAAASLILAGGLARAAHDKAGGEVHCAGINACKGQGSCSGAGNDCAGMNSCKGKGVTDVATKEECTKKGGKVVERKD